MNTRIRRQPVPLPEPDWALLRAFVAVADAGSLSRAAELLGSSQPTLSRQMSALEQHIGGALFERTRRGLRLTEAGQTLLGPAQRMQEHAREWSLAAAGQSQSLAGTVRITASETMSAFLLPPILRRLRDEHPQIQVEMVASNAVENLLERDADIALRMVKPAQSALIAKKVVELPLGFYAHQSYIQSRGMPSFETFMTHEWVGFDKSDQMIRGFREGGFKVTREFFAFRCDNQIVSWQAVKAGLGIGVGMQRVARLSPDLVRVLPQLPVPPLTLWITAHRELRSTPRLKTVFDALATALAKPE
ncbi:LysR family transcriptional regulator [Piscinibacter terrae]|uniref:LysR family transcriptional regulator n=1 Tax=Piscinibacter terrae TaxID=2496871 RepID=UPI0018E07C68|nr:LysR family transcriptional regulator [Albitalea terrae]